MDGERGGLGGEEGVETAIRMHNKINTNIPFISNHHHLG